MAGIVTAHGNVIAWDCGMVKILSDPVLKRLEPHGLPIFGSVMPDESILLCKQPLPRIRCRCMLHLLSPAPFQQPFLIARLSSFIPSGKLLTIGGWRESRHRTMQSFWRELLRKGCRSVFQFFQRMRRLSAFLLSPALLVATLRGSHELCRRHLDCSEMLSHAKLRANRCRPTRYGCRGRVTRRSYG